MAEDLKPPPKMTSQIGSPIGVLSFGKPRKVFQGSEGWLVEENPALRRPQLWRTLKALRTKLPIISTYVQLYNAFVAKAKFSFKPQEDGDTASVETAERLLWGDLEANWPRILVKMAAYRLAGFSVCEWIAEPDADGLWRLTDIVHLPQWSIHSMEMDKREKVVLFEQQVYGSVKQPLIPRAKTFYLAETSTVDSPYGRGVLADCAETGLQLLNLLELEQRGNLSNLRRKPNILAPLADLMQQRAKGEITQEQYDQMIGPLREFILGEDSGPDLNLILESQTYPALREGGAVESPTAARVWETIYPQPVPTDLSGQAPIERKNNELARQLGIEALLLGSTSTGSFALAEVQAGLFYQSIDSVLSDIADELQRVLRILWVANEGKLHPEAEQHQMEKEAEEQEKENAKAERLAQINGDKGSNGGDDAKLSKAIDDAEAVAVKPGDKGAAGPGKQGVPDPSKPMEPADYAAMAPEVQSDLSAYLSAGDLVELASSIAGLGLTVNPDSNMVRDMLDRAGLDADGAFQGLEEQHADKMEEMEARGFGEGPPDGEGGGGKPPPFGKGFVDFGRYAKVAGGVAALRAAAKAANRQGKQNKKLDPTVMRPSDWLARNKPRLDAEIAGVTSHNTRIKDLISDGMIANRQEMMNLKSLVINHQRHVGNLNAAGARGHEGAAALAKETQELLNDANAMLTQRFGVVNRSIANKYPGIGRQAWPQVRTIEGQAPPPKQQLRAPQLGFRRPPPMREAPWKRKQRRRN